MSDTVTLTVLMLDAHTLHVRFPTGQYLGIARHRIGTDLLAALRQRLNEPTQSHASAEPDSKHEILLNVTIEYSDHAGTPSVREILGLASADDE